MLHRKTQTLDVSQQRASKVYQAIQEMRAGKRAHMEARDSGAITDTEAHVSRGS